MPQVPSPMMIRVPVCARTRMERRDSSCSFLKSSMLVSFGMASSSLTVQRFIGSRVEQFKGSRNGQMLDTGFWILDNRQRQYESHRASSIEYRVSSIENRSSSASTSG
jgi:hypothetical protein